MLLLLCNEALATFQLMVTVNIAAELGWNFNASGIFDDIIAAGMAIPRKSRDDA
jgi:hypothetical protein